MTNRLAIEHSDRIKAGASVSGTIGCDLLQDGKSQVAPISMMHIHGTADEMVTYNNGSLMYYMFELPISKGGAEATVEFWRNTNGCDPTPEVYQFEDILILTGFDDLFIDFRKIARLHYKALLFKRFAQMIHQRTPVIIKRPCFDKGGFAVFVKLAFISDRFFIFRNLLRRKNAAVTIFSQCIMLKPCDMFTLRNIEIGSIFLVF